MPLTQGPQKREVLFRMVETFHKNGQHIHQLAALRADISAKHRPDRRIELEQAPIE